MEIEAIHPHQFADLSQAQEASLRLYRRLWLSRLDL